MNDPIQHMFDHTYRGVVTRIQIPIIYVTPNGSNKEHPMDRDELLSPDQVREIRLKREARRAKKTDDSERKLWQNKAPHKADRDELPEFVPELPPGIFGKV